MDRVIITGCGAVSAGGFGSDRLFRGELPEQRQVPPISADTTPAAKGLRRLPLPAQWASLASSEALTAAGGVADNHRAGVIVGTNRSSVPPIRTFAADAEANGARLVNPTLFPETVMNAVAGHVAIRFQLRGPTATFSAGRLTGFQALLGAMDLLQTRRLAQALVCGVEPGRPDRADATAYLPGQGAGAVLLERADEAVGQPLAQVEAICQLRTGAAVWDGLRTLDLPRPDEVICPGRLLPAPPWPASDPWEWTGDADGASTLFAVIAGLRSLANGRKRVWVVDTDQRDVAVLVLSAVP